MPRQSGITIANNFIKGLVTTASPLNFPEDAATFANNCNFTITGTVERRAGVDQESNIATNTISNPDNGAYSEFTWTNVGGIGNKSFVVVQQYQTLYFYDITGSTQVGSTFISSTNFSSFIGAGVTGDPGLSQCQFASGNGYLFVTNPLCDPFFVTYSAGNVLTTSAITIQTRDFAGMPEAQFPGGSNPITFRPTTTLVNLPINFPNHYYNLINQGWGLTSALTLWMGAEAFAPSNADFTAAYRSSPTIPFTSSYLGTASVGNAPAAKGHFILNEFDPDRSQALVNDGFSAIGNVTTLTYDQSFGTIIGNNANPSGAFDNNTSYLTGNFSNPTVYQTAFMFIGKNFGSVTNVISTTFYFSFSSTEGLGTGPAPCTFSFYGSNTAPTFDTNGNPTNVGATLLGTVSHTFVQNVGAVLTIPNGGGNHIYYWIQTTFPKTDPNGGGRNFVYYDEVYFNYTTGSTAIPVNSRPSCVAFYAGRTWFTGQQAAGMTSNVYFSQIINPTSSGGFGPSQAGMCYQANDPTSELIADLLPDDGGVIQIQDMGIVRKLFPFKSGLIIFASNGVWLVEGASGAGFQANNYLIRKLTAIGCIASNSVVNYKGTPVWWAEDGIYTLNYNPNYDSYDPQPLSYQVINEFFRNIPIANLQYVKGIYDSVDQLVIWLYNSNPSIPTTDVYKYDSALLLNGFTGSFFPWTFSYTSGGTGPFIRGALYIQDGFRQQTPAIKFLTTNLFNTISGNYGMFWSDNTSGSYFDWSNASGIEQDSPATFTSAYRLEGQTQKFFQPAYVFVFFKAMDNAQCQVQAFYDFTINSGANKFSQIQYAYPIPRLGSPSTTDFRSVDYRRLKIRGKGRALQLNFTSLPGQPFSIVGWSLDESVSPSV